MVKKMKKFIIPPHLDFITNKTLNPFAMFIFDFEVKLKESDLINIWQNISPDIGRSMTKAEASLPADIFPIKDLPMLANGLERKKAALMADLPDNTRWMIFKVKQRGAYNYFTKTADSKDDERFKFNIEIGSEGAEKTSVPDYSYNWPFDFFSLIELAKIDANITMTPKENTVLPKGKPAGATFDAGFAVEVFADAEDSPKEPIPPKGDAPSKAKIITETTEKNVIIKKTSKADIAKAAAKAAKAAQVAPDTSPVKLPGTGNRAAKNNIQPTQRGASASELPATRTSGKKNNGNTKGTNGGGKR